MKPVWRVTLGSTFVALAVGGALLGWVLTEVVTKWYSR